MPNFGAFVCWVAQLNAALYPHQSEEIKILNISFLRLKIVPTTCPVNRSQSHVCAPASRLASTSGTVSVVYNQVVSDVFPFLDRVVYLCLGDVVYAGPTRNLLDYFGSIGFPCPQLENPLMYYCELRFFYSLFCETRLFYRKL